MTLEELVVATLREVVALATEINAVAGSYSPGLLVITSLITAFTYRMMRTVHRDSRAMERLADAIIQNHNRQLKED